MFVDQIHILVQAGSGGNGCESYFRRTDKKAVPNGGDGGDGGSVIFRGDSNAPGLESFRYRQHIIAESGGHGSSSRKRGRNGKDLLMTVPIGTRIIDRTRNLLVRVLGAGEEVIVAQGGQGGVGNDGGKDASLGQRGAVIDIELKFTIPADIFLVGLPGSGKSALMNAFTRTALKEGPYPFSTRSPEIGVWEISDEDRLTLCELPSVYETSHEGRGLGVDFLKHLEKARMILYVLDPGSRFSESLAKGFDVLRRQVELFSRDFLEIPHAAVVTKMDQEGAQSAFRSQRFKPACPVFCVSLKTREGLEELKRFIKNSLLKNA